MTNERLFAWLSLYRRGPLGIFWLGVVAAGLLALGMVGVDALVVFPKGINVAFPWSILFYPLIAIVAEMSFHIVPIAILWRFFPKLARFGGWPIIVLVALPEAVTQTVLMDESTAWVAAFVAAYVYVFNVLQVYIGKRYGILAMYALRLTYYLVWHIVWGALRTSVLF